MEEILLRSFFFLTVLKVFESVVHHHPINGTDISMG